MNTRRIWLRALQAATPAALLSLLLGSHATPARADFPETVLHTFAGASSDGAGSIAGIEIGSDGTLYGSTERGGTKNLGTIFKIAPNGAYSILHNFGDGSVSNDGKFPASLNIGPDGNIDGMTIAGGAYNDGTVFTITPSGAVTILHSFSGGLDGANPYGGVTIGNDGKVYGVTSGIVDQSNNDYGTVFSMNMDGTQYLVQFRFTNANGGVDGQNPYCTLAPGLTGDSALYGTTYSGGSAGCGTIFSVTPGSADGSGTFQLLHTFGDGTVANDGDGPNRGRIQTDATGDLFGTTFYGGDSDDGTVWELAPGGAETILHSFEGGGDGSNPDGTLTLGSDGNYYGVTTDDGAFGAGELYSISKTGDAFSVVYDFDTAGDSSDGSNPYYEPTEDSNGNLLGTTFYGGAGYNGGVGVIYDVIAGLPNPVRVSSATLTPSSVTSGSTSQLLVTLRKPAPSGGAVVTLTSSAAAAIVPGSVTIPANAETATVTVKTGAVSKTTSATITAAYNTNKASATLTITPGSGSQLTSVSLSPASTPGTLSTTANRVSLSANASSDTTVTLTSSNTSVATVPSSVVIKAGSSSQLFTIATQAVTSAQTVTITAMANGVSQSGTLTVVPGLKSVTLQTGSVTGGTTTSTNRAYLTGNAAANTTVTLTSSNTAVATVPSTVAIQSGYSSHTFTITTKVVRSAQTVTITATSGGITKTATLTVTP